MTAKLLNEQMMLEITKMIEENSIGGTGDHPQINAAGLIGDLAERFALAPDGQRTSIAGRLAAWAERIEAFRDRWYFIGNPMRELETQRAEDLRAGAAALLDGVEYPTFSPEDLFLLDHLKRDNVWGGARPVLERGGTPEMEQAFRLSESGHIALEQVARGVRLHITRKGVRDYDKAVGH